MFGGLIESIGGLFSGLGGAFGEKLLDFGFDTATGAINDYYNRRSAKTAYERYLHMSNTAHQREVADLRAAGLNPVLASLGNGASTAMVPSHSGSQPATQGSISARALAQKQAEAQDSVIEANEAQAELNSANALKAQSDIALNNAKTEEQRAKNVMTVLNSNFFKNLPEPVRKRIQFNMLNEVAHSGINSSFLNGYARAPVSYGRKANSSRSFGEGLLDENLILQALDGYSVAGKALKSIWNHIRDDWEQSAAERREELQKDEMYSPKEREERKKERNKKKANEWLRRQRIMPLGNGAF